MVFLLGTPELALPSEWAEARARIGDGSYPAGYIVDIISGVLALAWGAGLWFLLTGLFKQDQSAHDESAHDESIHDETDVPITGPGSEPDEPWYRQGPPIFDEPFSDEYPRVVVPPDDMIADDGPQDSVWQPATMTADVGDPLGMLSPDATDEDMFSDAEIIGDVYGSNPDEPPMIVPVRAYYFTRAEDTLRSISAQFLQTPRRWQELRALNAASPGVAAARPDTLLPVGTALALPGDPLPWGKPDPVYLWTLAEKFLFTAWGREPTPEEVVPFWRGLTSGTQLEAGAPFRPEHLTAPTEPPAPEVARESAPTPTQPPLPGGFLSPPPPVPGMEPPPAPAAFQPPPLVTPPAYQSPVPPTHEPPPPAYEPPLEPAAFQPPFTPPAYQSPVPPTHEPPPAYEPPLEPAAFQPPPLVTPPAYQSPVPPTHEPPPAYEPPLEPAAFQPPPLVTPPAYQSPVPPTHEPPPAYEPPLEPAAFQPPPLVTPPAYQSPVPPTHEPPPAYEPPPPAYESPVPPTHEPPPAYLQPPPPAYEPPLEPAAFQPPFTPPAYEPPVPPSHEPPPAYEPPPPAYQSPVPPTHEPPPPAYESPVAPTHAPMAPGPIPDFGPIEPEVPYVEAEAPRMPSFMPSLTGAESAARTPEAEVVAASSRSLAGTAIGDAMMLWQLGRIRRRRGGRPDALDPMEESLRQNARVDTLNLIEAAMRHLRAVTVGRLREKPAVLAVRVGTYGFEVLLDRPAQAPEGWQAASGGYVLELPQGVTADDLDTTAQGPTLCPALVPVGDTLEGPLLLNVEEIGCLIVSGPGSPSVNLLNAVVGTLGSSPLAGDIRIITVGLDTPAGLPGWERVHSTSFDSPQLEELLSAAHTGSGASLDVLIVGPGNDLLIQRAGQVATTPGSRLALVGATSSVAARWPWRIHVDETTTAVVHPIACTMAAAQAMAPAMSQLLSEATDPSLFAPPRY